MEQPILWFYSECTPAAGALGSGRLLTPPALGSASWGGSREGGEGLGQGGSGVPGAHLVWFTLRASASLWEHFCGLTGNPPLSAALSSDPWNLPEEPCTLCPLTQLLLGPTCHQLPQSRHTSFTTREIPTHNCPVKLQENILTDSGTSP